ncbi:MAG TPA: hypothetical protein P5509_10845 [Bacteroidales bacterium]|nr:hypothetical protein [Bacteroidales bacterium]
MGKLPEDIKVGNIELIVEYDCGNHDYLQLRQVSPSDNGLFDIAILDKEQDERTGETKLNLVQIEYLEAILADFKDKLKKLGVK